jgi:predicted CXXCH cytochrome family protein
MRPVFLAVLLLSCTGDESRRAPEPARPSEAHGPQSRRVAEAEPPLVLRAKQAPTAPADPRAATRQAAHDVLAEHCGECHEGHRSTNPKALAVFDLDQPDWPSRFNEQRFGSALRRLGSKPEPARAAFIAFRDAELAAASDRAN